MTRRARVVAIGSAVGVVVVVGGLLLVRAALDPERLRLMAEEQLSGAFGQPVRIGRMDVRLLPVPAVEGREIVVGAASGSGGPTLTLEAIRIVPRLSTVLSTPIEIDRVELSGLAVDVGRDEDGRPMLPLPSGAASAAPEGESRFAVNRIVLTGGRVRVVGRAGSASKATAVVIEPIEAVIGRDGDQTLLESLSATIGEATISGSGRVGPDGMNLSLAVDSLKPADAATLFALAGIDPPAGLAIEGERPLTIDVAVGPDGAITAAGRVAAERATLGTLTLSTFDVPIRLDGGRLVLEPLTFSAYGGKARGSFRADVGASPVTWTIEVQIDGVDAGEMVGAAVPGERRLDGRGRFEATLGGRSDAPLPRGLAGRAGFDLADGVLRDVALLSVIDAALGIDEVSGRDFHFERLSGTFQVAGHRATTSDLAARAGTLSLAARGSIGFEGDLAFTGTATFSREKSQELIRRVRELSGARNAQGEIEVPFDVSGTMAAPRFSVNTARILGRAAEKELQRQIERRLKGWIKKQARPGEAVDRQTSSQATMARTRPEIESSR